MTVPHPPPATRGASAPPAPSGAPEALRPAGEPAADPADEVARARRLAERYRVEFADMDRFSMDADLFRSIPADLMLRYGFVPYRKVDGTLVIVVSDPDLPTTSPR